MAGERGRGELGLCCWGRGRWKLMGGLGYVLMLRSEGIR